MDAMRHLRAQLSSSISRPSDGEQGGGGARSGALAAGDDDDTFVLPRAEEVSDAALHP